MSRTSHGRNLEDTRPYLARAMGALPAMFFTGVTSARTGTILVPSRDAGRARSEAGLGVGEFPLAAADTQDCRILTDLTGLTRFAGARTARVAASKAFGAAA